MSGRPARKPWASPDLRSLHERTWKTQEQEACRRECESLATALAGETQQAYMWRKLCETGDIRPIESAIYGYNYGAIIIDPAAFITLKTWMSKAEFSERYPGFRG